MTAGYPRAANAGTRAACEASFGDCSYPNVGAVAAGAVVTGMTKARCEASGQSQKDAAGKWIKLPGVFTTQAEWESVNREYDRALYETVALGERSVGYAGLSVLTSGPTCAKLRCALPSAIAVYGCI